jgi:hypothetical protein
MALAKCADCGREVSTEAAACPNCGRPMNATTAPTPPAAQQRSATAAQPPQPKQKNWFRRHPILTIILGLIVIGAISSAAASKGQSPRSSANTSNPAATSRPITTPASTAPTLASKPAKPKPTLTGPQQQAVEAAQNYLSMGSGFSRSGLIKQLSSSYGSGFPKAVAVFAVDHLNVAWNQQAVLAAKGYKETGGGFSCSGMIQQLSSSYGSGFTHAQAVYGARKAGVC